MDRFDAMYDLSADSSVVVNYVAERDNNKGMEVVDSVSDSPPVLLVATRTEMKTRIRLMGTNHACQEKDGTQSCLAVC